MGSDPLLVLAASSPNRLSLARILLGDTLVGTVKGMVFMLQGKMTSCEHWVTLFEFESLTIALLMQSSVSEI